VKDIYNMIGGMGHSMKDLDVASDFFNGPYKKGYRDGHAGKDFENHYGMKANNEAYFLGWLDGKGDRDAASS